MIFGLKNFFNSVIIFAFSILLLFGQTKAQTNTSTTYYQKNQRFLGRPTPADPMMVQRNVRRIADSLKTFLDNQTGCNKNIVFIVNMRIVSGRKRFFVYDYSRNAIIDEGLAAHGSGSDTIVEGLPRLHFSNMPNSSMTSLGKYYIGKSYSGEWGKSYRLYGVDETNSNADERNIVLHAYDAIPDEEQFYPIAESDGCPMVSRAFFRRLENIIDRSSSKILLYICYIPFQ